MLSIIKDNSPHIPLAHNVLNAYRNAIDHHGYFTVALSGGSLPTLLAKALQSITNDKIDYSKWHIFYADERCVLHSSPDSNHNACVESLYSVIPDMLDRAHIYPINESLVNAPEHAAEHYASTLQSTFSTLSNRNKEEKDIPQFDLILLGMGPDGHTCSLFPSHPLLTESKHIVASLTDSPKPPPSRITLTFPVLNHAKACTFVCTGLAKADIVKEILVDQSIIYPAGRVECQVIYWILDEQSSSKL